MILDEEDYIEFLKKVDEGLKHQVGLVPTPKIEEARKLIKEYCNMEWKENINTLKRLNERRMVEYISTVISNNIFNCTLPEAELKIINFISNVMNRMYRNKNLIPLVETEIDYNSGKISICFDFSDYTMSFDKEI